MPEQPLQLEVKGLDKIVKAFDKFPKEIQASMEKAGKEASEEIIQTEGVSSYPPIMGQWRPPHYPWYQRGRGTWTSPDHNLGNSELLGKKEESWFIKAQGYNTKVGTTVTYAQWVVGDQQSDIMARFGWRKLFATAKSKTREITRIYQNRVNKLIRRLGL